MLGGTASFPAIYAAWASQGKPFKTDRPGELFRERSPLHFSPQAPRYLEQGGNDRYDGELDRPGIAGNIAGAYDGVIRLNAEFDRYLADKDSL